MKSSFEQYQRENFLRVFKRRVPFLTVLITISLQSALFKGTSAVSGPNGPRFSPLIPPPQVLLPPHREEGQSLDDIIYGTSFSGSALSNFPFLKNSPVEVPRPSVSSTIPPASSSPSAPPLFRSNVNNSLNTPLPPPSPTSRQQSRIFSHSNNNINLVQTFTPPSTRPPPSSSNTVFSPPISVPSITSFTTSSSAEEIKIPQTVKHRTPQRKQYTKADLIAAANSIKPAGFDFSKVLIVTPSNNNLNLSSSSDATSLYNRVMFPLPLFDTPVYKPLMEMLMKANYNLGGGSASDNKKVLVIIPKQSNGAFARSLPSGRSANGANSNPLLNNSKPPLKHPLQPSATTISSSKSSSTSKQASFPKAPASKYATTIKPKPLPQVFSTTTKRASKIGSFPSSTFNIGNAKVTGKKSDKGPDLQAAATSNKISQRHGANSPSSASSSEKRSYSSKGGDNYSFSYAVKNDAYKDIKSHSESRDGDSVAGEYSMLEADGYTRVVRYTVDSDQGFKASVKRIPPS